MLTCHISRKILLVIIILMISNYYAVQCGMHQKRLLEKLFQAYDASERPVTNEEDKVEVAVGLSIQQIVDIDEKQQIIIFSGWLDMTWTDENLKWNPEDYGNITKLSVMSSKVWLPDLLLYNSADDSFDPKTPVNVVLYNTGFITYLPPGMFKSNCIIEIYQFPFDDQRCFLKFGSWTLDTSTVNLKNQSDSAQLDSYVANGEWAMESVISYPTSVKYECCEAIYPFVMFVMHLRRRTLYFIFNFVFPCILISFMSILGFCLPPDSGEKIGLEMTTLLSIIMFSQLITGIIPESSLSVPKISLYFASITVICTICIVSNVLVLILHHQNIKIQRPMPDWIDNLICRKLGKFLRMQVPNKSTPKSPVGPNYKGTRPNDITESSSKSLLANVLDINDDYFNKNSSRFKSKSNGDTYVPHTKPVPPSFKAPDIDEEDYANDANPIKRNLGAILKELKTMTQKIEDDDADEEKILNWKFAAMVIDRLCMVIFSIATFLSTVLILLTSENFFKFV